MEIREIIYIKAIADFSNLTKAAEYLHITQPSLSQSLKSIESRLGVTLFNRTKRGMLLTEYGERFVEDASSLLASYHEFIDKIEQYEINTTRLIGLYKLSYTTLVNNAVMSFISHHYGDNYMIKVDSISNLEMLLLQRKLDIAIIKYTPIHQKNRRLTYDVLFKERLYVLVNKDHKLAGKSVIKVADLKGCALITSDPTEYPYKMTVEMMSRADVELNIHTYTNYSNLSMIFDLVGRGLGVTFATEYVCDHYAGEDVVKIPLEEIYDYEVCVVQRKSDEKNHQFIDFVKEHLDAAVKTNR